MGFHRTEIRKNQRILESVIGLTRYLKGLGFNAPNRRIKMKRLTQQMTHQITDENGPVAHDDGGSTTGSGGGC